MAARDSRGPASISSMCMVFAETEIIGLLANEIVADNFVADRLVYLPDVRSAYHDDTNGVDVTAASDAHHAAAVGTAYTIVNTDDFSVRGILAQIVKSNELNQQYQTPRDSLRKTWNNWLRLRRRRKIPEVATKDRSHNGD